MKKKIVDEQKNFEILKKTQRPAAGRVLEILAKAKKKKGLNLEEANYLIHAPSELTGKILEAAGRVKKEIYGERLVFFAPLYVSSFCVNDCEYCGFHRRNPAPRRKLSLAEVARQAKVLEDMGHKRLLLEFGEDPVNNPIDYVVDVIRTIYNAKSKNGSIRRVNVNIAATTVEDYRKLKEAGIGTYQLFQETYHRPTYEKLHRGPKADYDWHLTAHDRAMKAGIDDVGLGVLFGLYDWRFEVLALISHAQYLDKIYGIGPHTFSVPRFQPASTVDFRPDWPVSDEDFLKIIAILRLAVPYTGMIISTRESPQIRAKAFEIGISQTSAGSKTDVGGYEESSKFKVQSSKLDQFKIQDERSLDEVLRSVLKQGLLPSFCTACYRSGRTGKTFMDLAKPGNIHNFCRPNAILTFQEYLEDYASPAVRQTGAKIIKKYLDEIPDAGRRNETRKRIEKIKKGERDLYF